jgi:hypothetical protein
MAVPPADFRAVKGHFLSLDALKTDSDGWVTAIAVTIEGIVGGENVRRRQDRILYRLLASVQDLQSEIPTVWIASPRNEQIQHVNIFPPKLVCPFVGASTPATLRDHARVSAVDVGRPPPDDPELCGQQKIARWPLASA